MLGKFFGFLLFHAIRLCGGIAAANGVWISLALLGIETVRGFAQIIIVLRYLGAVYLLSIGIVLLLAKPVAEPDVQGRSTPANGKALKVGFRLGFLSAILNPKNIIFYLALFTSLVSPKTPFAQRGLYGLWMMSVVLIWDRGLTVFIRRSRLTRLSPKWSTALEKMAGIALAGFGLLLPFT